MKVYFQSLQVFLINPNQHYVQPNPLWVGVIQTLQISR